VEIVFTTKRLRVRSFGVIWIRINDPRSLGSRYIKGTDESVTSRDSFSPYGQDSPEAMLSAPADVSPLLAEFSFGLSPGCTITEYLQIQKKI